MTGAVAAGGAGVRRAGGAAGRDRSTKAEFVRRISPCLEAAGFYLEDVTVRRAGSRSVVQVVIDRDGGVDLDAVADASRLIGAELDAWGEGEADSLGPYVLEVSSPGVDRPLTLPRHWRRAAGRLVSVHTRDGRRILGRVRAATDDAVELVPHAAPAAGGRRRRAGAGEAIRVLYGDVARALVQVEFDAVTDQAAPDSVTDQATPDAVTDLPAVGERTDTDEEMGS